MPRWSRMFSRIPCTEPTTPRLPLIYFGVRGLPVEFSAATMTASPILYLLSVYSIVPLNPGAPGAFPASPLIFPPVVTAQVLERSPHQSNCRRSRAWLIRSPTFLPCRRAAAAEQNNARRTCCRKPELPYRRGCPTQTYP